MQPCRLKRRPPALRKNQQPDRGIAMNNTTMGLRDFATFGCLLAACHRKDFLEALNHDQFALEHAFMASASNMNAGLLGEVYKITNAPGGFVHRPLPEWPPNFEVVVQKMPGLFRGELIVRPARDGNPAQLILPWLFPFSDAAGTEEAKLIACLDLFPLEPVVQPIEMGNGILVLLFVLR